MTRSKIYAAIALFLIFAMAFSLLASPSVNAQAYKEKTTYAYVIVTPNPVGVGQAAHVICGTTDYLYQYPDGWTGITVTVTKPDGTTETLGPFKTDATGSTGTTYVPATAGNYTFQSHFPAQWYNWTFPALFDPTFFGPVYYLASDSPVFSLTVQTEPLPSYPGFPLPTEYWTRPIDAQKREWAQIAGNWVDAPFNMFAENNKGPETAHVLWAEPLVKGAFSPLGGGLSGGYTSVGPSYELGFETGDAYEGFFMSSSMLGSRWPVIIGGVVYYNVEKTDGGTRIEREVQAVDLRTGEVLWTRNWNNSRLDFGQLFYWSSFNYHAVYAYLYSVVGTTYNVYEASNGRWVFSVSDVPFGTRVYGPNGEILIYTVNQQAGWMTLWNLTQVERQQKIRDLGPTGPGHGSWLNQGPGYMGTTLNGTLGYMWNKTIPLGLPGSAWAVYYNDMIVGNQLYGGWMVVGEDPAVFWAISTKQGQEGQLLYNKTWTRPVGDIAMVRVAVSKDSRVFALRAKEKRQIYGFNLDTGDYMWGPTEELDVRSIYGATGYIAYDKLLFTADFAGKAYCYDVKTGALEWTYEVRDPYGASEMYQKEFGGEMWPITPLFITDGKLYIGQSEHSPENPLPRGAPFVCVDIETGNEVFRVNGMFRQTRWGGRAIIGDSIITTMDAYDMRVYGIGKGPTLTTVSAPDNGVPFGTSVMIRGTVMDVSQGTKSSEVALRFPNGVSAVSDENQSAWMLYVYKQFEPAPHETWIGVSVNLYVVDANMNARPIGTATTSAENGAFAFAWTPDITGTYYLYAEFAGSKAYYVSHAETAFVVDEAPEPTVAPTQPPASLADQYLLPGIGIIVAAIAVVGAVIVLMLRKR